jgi:hypothetical protein
MTDFTSYRSIQSNLFVRIAVNEYRSTDSGAYASTVLRFSDLMYPYTIAGESYTGIGKLMGVSTTASEIRVSENQVTITVSGVPNTSLAEIINSKIKGSNVIVYRGVFNTANGNLIATLGRYRGFINNYTLTEDYDYETRTASNTVQFICSSVIDVLTNKVSGRKTNPDSEAKFYPNDLSFNRVPTLKNENFDFGKTT